jgi:uncharacterized membrane protein YraQ (UPF0718 family)
MIKSFNILFCQNPLIENSIKFFLHNTLKIFSLIFISLFVLSFIRSFISTEKIKQFLSHKKFYLSHLIASLLGIITPFCSCSGIPFFISIIEAGVPVGITFSFLIASPLINEIVLVMLLGLFGIKITLIYISSGLIISFFSGIFLEKINAKKWILKDILTQDFSSIHDFCNKNSIWKNKLLYAKKYTFSILKKIWLYIILAIAIGSLIHGYIPNDFLIKYANATKWYDIPLVTALGIPLYSNAAGAIPLITSLTEKGLSIGTALSFMMAVTSLSLPEFFILKRIMKLKLLMLFISIVGSGIIIIGYLFKFLL